MNGKPKGYVVQTDGKFNLYEGYVLDGVRNGLGKEVSFAGVYRGSFKDDERHGRGKNNGFG